VNTVQEAIIAKQTWRSPVMDKYITGFLTAGLTCGREYVNNDDVAEEYQVGDKHTTGSAIKQLLMAKIIHHWTGCLPDKNIYGGMRPSTRAGNNGHRNPLYTLNAPMAKEWLRRHGGAVGKVEQLELAV